MMRHLRVLPVLIFACMLMLFMRVENILAASKEIAKEEAKKEETKKEEPAKEEAKKDEKAADAPKDPSAPENLPKPAVESENAHVPEKTADPMLFNDSELDILQSLSARRSQLDERERQIEQKEGLLQITEQRIDQKLTELKNLKSGLETTKQEMEKLTKTFDDKEKEKLAGLVKTYESMKPKEAARIFDLLEMPILIDVISQMKEAKMAPILASMDPAKAKAVTSELANRKLQPEGKTPPAAPEKLPVAKQPPAAPPPAPAQ